MVAQSSGQWSDYGLIRGPFRLGRSDQRQFRAHLQRTRCFERTLVWSEDALVWEGLIRGNFRLARSDHGSLPDGTSTWEILYLTLKMVNWHLSRLKWSTCSSNLNRELGSWLNSLWLEEGEFKLPALIIIQTLLNWTDALYNETNKSHPLRQQVRIQNRKVIFAKRTIYLNKEAQ